MKKILFTIIILWGLAFNVYSQESLAIHDEIFDELENEKEFAQKHNLKSVSKYVFKDIKKADSILLNSKEYNIESNITRKVNRYSKTPKDSSVTQYKYDSLNQIKEIKTTYSEYSYISLYKFQFNDNGKRVELYYDFGTKNDLELQKYTYSLHEDGRINTKQFNQILFGHIYYIYDSNKQLINISYVKNDIEPFIIYDSNGNIIMSKSKNGAKNVYKYDEKGSLIEKYFQDEYSEIKNYLKWSYKYDDSDNPIEVNTFNKSGKLKSRSTYEYNTKNLPVTLINYDKKGRINFTLKYYYTYYN